MAFKDLRDYIRLMEERGRLAHITQPVTAKLEITEITDRVCRGPLSDYKALLFGRVHGDEIVDWQIPAEGHERPWLELVTMSSVGKERIDALWHDLRL